MEPEVQSLETSEMVMVTDEQCENHSPSPHIIHLEGDPYGLGGADEEEEVDLQSSTLSFLGGEKELAEMRAEIGTEPDLRPPETVEILMCVEDPIVEDMEPEDASSPIFTHIPLLSEPSDFTLASIPIPEIISQVLEHLPSRQELPQTSIPKSLDDAHILESETNAPSVSQEGTSSSSEGFLPNADTSGAPVRSFFENPVFLAGGAAVMAMVGVLTYRFNRK